ncbi:dTDP-4-dehydrorhamnose 3,5-epimerase [Cohnella herbarum]|uniref:dTDP-4-dehydrorhamnose 3,5-epimerase n=1 Tax=Cohnella herbarum TaxID=2728023 RepID=A0A7Z2ZMR2_9BACL|nr:dTDP-4-dehydrorhamnose 3,5-epimerase [Cohnella herbarum]QJD85249.1 dTDP-4-dehydrorhamnose 3,5-epimerase [Cohnella herbarum]
MKVIESKLQGAKLIEPSLFEDHRGFFMESYHAEGYAAIGLPNTYVQDNHSLSIQVGVLRGLHYQLNPKAQSKLVRVTAGSIFDAIVDIRKGSPTFGQWEGFELSAENKRQLFVPSGFAHGFCTVAPNTEVQYKVDNFFSPEQDRGILWNDPTIGIEWPTNAPILSDKDSRHPGLLNAHNNFVY